MNSTNQGQPSKGQSWNLRGRAKTRAPNLSRTGSSGCGFSRRNRHETIQRELVRNRTLELLLEEAERPDMEKSNLLKLAGLTARSSSAESELYLPAGLAVLRNLRNATCVM